MEFLNGKFDREDDFFAEILKLLSNYQWIYKTRNTDILADRILSCVPESWIPILQIKNFDDIQYAIQGESKLPWPADLVKLVSQCKQLSLRIETKPTKEITSASKWKKINPKKIHEVVNFSQLIGENCVENKINHVVDIGAGLGYLDKELAKTWNVQVLGLERDTYRVSAANQRSETSAECRATFKELTVNTNDTLQDQIDFVVDEWLSELKIELQPVPLCMIGLHSCGDLSPVMMKLFLNSHRFQSLLLVSCCYHRMEWSKTSQDNFPLSQSLNNTSHKLQDVAFHQQDVPFHQQEGIQHLFRLAAQETPNQWLQQDTPSHLRQVQHTFYRAVIQQYAAQENIPLLKQQRKPVKKGKVSDAIEDYIDEVIEGFGLKGEHHRGKLMDVYYSNRHLLPALETLIILQVLLQPVAEALILVDRLVFLEENGLARASLKQIFDDRISPRCFVTMAEKLRNQNKIVVKMAHDISNVTLETQSYYTKL